MLEELYRHGVRNICIAPGSRSTPLTLEAQAHSGITTHTHFDERGLGFLALGMAKALKQPVAVIVTSGTAVANLLPAVAESALTGEPLILLTADRPQNLIDCGANQAINQREIFGSHVTASLELPNPFSGANLNWLLSSIDQLIHKQQHSGGALHINCPFPEPLYGEVDEKLAQRLMAQIHMAPKGQWLNSDKPYTPRVSPSTLGVVTQEITQYHKPLFVIGSIDNEQASKVVNFAIEIGAVALCDPQSGASSKWAHYDLWFDLESAKEQLAECDAIIQFGGRVVSKRLNQWIASHVLSQTCAYLLIHPEDKRFNEYHLPQTHYQLSAEQWLIAHEHSTWQCDSTWSEQLSQHSQKAKLAIEDMVDEALTELSLASCLGKLETPNTFIGNSMIVRLVDMVSELNEQAVYSNRGASGIDGLVATALGVQQTLNEPLHLLIGDTSLLYDLNSLALLTQSKAKLIITVINNDGGAIFDMLPVPQAQKQSFYQMPHGLTFEHAAKQFGLGYECPTSVTSYVELVNHHLQNGEGPLLIEVRTPPDEVGNQLRQLRKQLNA